MKNITDSDRIDFIAEMSKKSRTGVSIETYDGCFRIDWYHYLGDYVEDIRTAIDKEINKVFK